MVNQTSKARYHGRKDLTSLIEFYEESTGDSPHHVFACVRFFWAMLVLSYSIPESLAEN